MPKWLGMCACTEVGGGERGNAVAQIVARRRLPWGGSQMANHEARTASLQKRASREEESWPASLLLLLASCLQKRAHPRGRRCCAVVAAVVTGFGFFFS